MHFYARKSRAGEEISTISIAGNTVAAPRTCPYR